MKTTATILLITGLLVGTAAPLATASHPHNHGRARITYSTYAQRSLPTAYVKGRAAGSRAGWNAGYRAGKRGLWFDARCGLPNHRNTRYAQGYKDGFASAYRAGYRQGRQDRRGTCFFRW